jgi:hypothetical protein
MAERDLTSPFRIQVRLRLLPGGLEDLVRFANEFAPCLRRAKRHAGPVDDRESGSRLDLGDHLLQGSVAPAVEGALLRRGCRGRRASLDQMTEDASEASLYGGAPEDYATALKRARGRAPRREDAF